MAISETNTFRVVYDLRNVKCNYFEDVLITF